MRTEPRNAFFSLVLAAVLLVSSAGVSAADGTDSRASVGLKLVDMILVRPFAASAAIASSGFYLATLPVTVWSGVYAADYLVVVPWRFTVGRYLGDFNSYVDSRTWRGRTKTR